MNEYSVIGRWLHRMRFRMEEGVDVLRWHVERVAARLRGRRLEVRRAGLLPPLDVTEEDRIRARAAAGSRFRPAAATAAALAAGVVFAGAAGAIVTSSLSGDSNDEPAVAAKPVEKQTAPPPKRGNLQVLAARAESRPHKAAHKRAHRRRHHKRHHRSHARSAPAVVVKAPSHPAAPRHTSANTTHHTTSSVPVRSHTPAPAPAPAPHHVASPPRPAPAPHHSPPPHHSGGGGSGVSFDSSG